uniref:Reverse transcriptase domain-containing protein n=1 Tax=Chenopodium quinoa TaxID=63459 RepID=A0A803MSN8_CHEQI
MAISLGNDQGMLVSKEKHLRMYSNEEFTDKEVKDAMFRMAPLKAPGPDGCPPIFIQHCWNIVGQDVCAAVKSFFRSGHLLRELNMTHLCLLPKVINANKVDLNKAYDRIRWDFVEKVLRQMKFPELWIGWIMECISSVSYALLINGEPSRWFNPKVGLRQGDPISPYLFILCMEVLSRRMVSKEKSYVIFIPNTRRLQKVLRKPLYVKQEQRLGTYLGCPMEIDGRNASSLSFLVEKVYQKTLSWKFLTLSQAGKLVRINSILIAILSHVISLYLLPKKVMEKLTSTCLRFFWGTSMEKRLIYWRKNEVLKIRKEQGGLSLRNIPMLNTSLLYKQEWRIHNDSNSLVSKVLKGKYKHSPVIYAMQNKMPRIASWAFRSMTKAAVKMKVGLGKCISNGRNTSILDDCWLRRGKIEFRSSVPEDEKQRHKKYKGTCEEGALLTIFTDGAWKKDKNGRVVAGIGWVIKGQQGEISQGEKNIIVQTPIQAELAAIKEGII